MPKIVPAVIASYQVMVSPLTPRSTDKSGVAVPKHIEGLFGLVGFSITGHEQSGAVITKFSIHPLLSTVIVKSFPVPM